MTLVIIDFRTQSRLKIVLKSAVLRTKRNAELMSDRYYKQRVDQTNKNKQY